MTKTPELDNQASIPVDRAEVPQPPYERLRAPFPAEQIGKLPRVTCRACSQAPGKVCSDHRKERCADCGGYLTTAHIHLDYVGHAAVTSRLLEVDPAWTWEPVAMDAQGLPAITDRGGLADEPLGLWIRLTVLGVTRLGFGGGRNVKECIGDGLRNAAMRFGVALDLWSKQDLHPAPVDDQPAVKTDWARAVEIVRDAHGETAVEAFGIMARQIREMAYGDKPISDAAQELLMRASLQAAHTVAGTGVPSRADMREAWYTAADNLLPPLNGELTGPSWAMVGDPA